MTVTVTTRDQDETKVSAQGDGRQHTEQQNKRRVTGINTCNAPNAASVWPCLPPMPWGCFRLPTVTGSCSCFWFCCGSSDDALPVVPALVPLT